MKRHLFVLLSGLLVAPVALAQTTDDKTKMEDKKAGKMDKAGKKTTAMAKLTEGQIVAMSMTSHLNEINASAVVLERASNPEVKKFAEMMVTHHSIALSEGNAIAARAQIAPERTADVTNLESEGNTAYERLRGLTGAELDRAYINQMVMDHQRTLDALDKQLIPGARNAELKKHLTAFKPKAEAHLKQAKDLQKKLGAST